eukprot:14628065-Alexandrium_andersonii.AAC.1
MADCGLRRIAALTGLAWIADCTLGPLRCKDARSVGTLRPSSPQIGICGPAKLAKNGSAGGS